MIVAWLKALHIIALIIWCAALIGLPLLLAKHEEDEEQAVYARLRRMTHHAYVRIVTPAAVVAIAAGTVLIYVREVFVPWLFAKLVAVGLLVALHALVGHTIVLMSERRGRYAPPGPAPLIAAMTATMAAVLFLVLAKPVVPDLRPAWLEKPVGRPLPVTETPLCCAVIRPVRRPRAMVIAAVTGVRHVAATRRPGLRPASRDPAPANDDRACPGRAGEAAAMTERAARRAWSARCCSPLAARGRSPRSIRPAPMPGRWRGCGGSCSAA
ncbi:MAG: CopD family protein, partial [Sphingomonas sp.]